MKCFSILLLLWAASTLANSFYIEPIDEARISPGQNISVRISPEDPGTEIPKVVGERIGGVFYIMRQRGDVLDALVAPPQNLDEIQNERSQNVFKPRGFNYEHKGMAPIEEYFVADTPYELKGKPSFWWFLLLALAAPLSVWIFKSWRRRRKLKAEAALKRARLQEIEQSVLRAKTRREIESIYGYRKEISEGFDVNEKSMQSFLEYLETIQYKPSWSEYEIDRIESLLNNLRKDLRIKSGI